MRTQPEVTHALGLDCGQSIRVKELDLDVEYCTDLATNWRCTVEINEDKNHDRESGQARDGINLSRGWI